MLLFPGRQGVNEPILGQIGARVALGPPLVGGSLILDAGAENCASSKDGIQGLGLDN